MEWSYGVENHRTSHVNNHQAREASSDHYKGFLLENSLSLHRELT